MGSKRKKMVVVDKVDKVLHFLEKGLQIGQLIFAIVTLGLARLGDGSSSLQFGSSLDSHWLGQMTTAGWVIVLCSSLLGRQLGDPANLGDVIPKEDVQKLLAELADPEDEEG